MFSSPQVRNQSEIYIKKMKYTCTDANTHKQKMHMNTVISTQAVSQEHVHTDREDVSLTHAHRRSSIQMHAHIDTSVHELTHGDIHKSSY
mmetsp:Transcript_32153/g.57573  ORF Transcript_32153/g.57573 Transcript_32153/m.57573 type:complete len:90 (-) Transcript_32153:63-332(-)